MRLTELFTIDAQPVVVPDGDLLVHTENLEAADSGRDESGVYHRFGVREGVTSWDFSYARLTREEYAYMEELFAGKDTFAFRYRSAGNGPWVEVTAYRSKHSILWHTTPDGQFRDYRFRIVSC